MWLSTGFKSKKILRWRYTLDFFGNLQ